MRRAFSAVAFSAALGLSTPSAAAALRVSPVLLDLSGAQRAASLTLTNADTRAAAVQVRVFRWTQQKGDDKLDPTRDVVVSPPAMRLQPGGQHLIRVVRTAQAPVTGEEAYRVLIDEIPDPTTPRQNGVAFVLRQSLPVFFGAGGVDRPQVVWRLVHGDAGWSIIARNSGRRRLRIAEMTLTDAAGKRVANKPGLLGYILSGAEMHWPLQADVEASKAATLTPVTDAGPLRVDLDPSSTR